jgi:Holliday junction DNA helicase RuvA
LTLHSAVIEVGGVGILVNLPVKFATSLTVGKSTEIFTSLIVREDSLTLYGFERFEAKDFFELLQTVSGIGPKVAQSALSIFEPEELGSAINMGETKVLEQIPGLGKKGAARLILELKDKVENKSTHSKKSVAWRAPLESALAGLGFTAKEVDSILNKLSEEKGSRISEASSSELLKAALALRGRG